MLLSNVLITMVCIVILAAALIYGARLGYKGTITYLQLRGDLPDTWPAMMDDMDYSGGTVAACEHCEEETALYKCRIKNVVYNMCESCMNVMNARPHFE